LSWAIWITGVPGSGKTALAQAAARELRAAGEPVRVLELDEIRRTLTPQPTYTDAEREVVYRALVYMATLLTEVDVPVIIDATAHRRTWRQLARRAIPRFAEVQLVCPPDVVRQRERTRPPGHAPHGIYARAGRPGATVPGVDVPYERALAPELVIDTGHESLTEAVAKIVALGRTLANVRLHDAPPAPGWAIWITGPPGSGKTTLAEGVAETLTSRGMRVKVLPVAAARVFLVADAAPSERQQEIVHRALAYTAKLLTEVGVAVIIDATAPRRAWRETARELIPCFAEVQLVCPAAVCLERERATRWRLTGAGTRVRERQGAPEMSHVYEESLRPELVLHTDTYDPWTAVEQVLFLINRLRRLSPVNLEPRY
jgi:adenylylsulfate kinase